MFHYTTPKHIIDLIKKNTNQDITDDITSWSQNPHYENDTNYIFFALKKYIHNNVLHDITLQKTKEHYTFCNKTSILYIKIKRIQNNTFKPCDKETINDIFKYYIDYVNDNINFYSIYNNIDKLNTLIIDTMRFEDEDFDIKNKLINLSQQLIDDNGTIIIVLPNKYLQNNKCLTDKMIIKVLHHNDISIVFFKKAKCAKKIINPIILQDAEDMFISL
jgi:hypothetical protein